MSTGPEEGPEDAGAGPAVEGSTTVERTAAPKVPLTAALPTLTSTTVGQTAAPDVGGGGALRRLLSCEAADFAAWGAPHCWSGTADDFTDLFSPAARDELLSAPRPAHAVHPAGASDGDVLPGAFTGPAGVGADLGDQVDRDASCAELADGATARAARAAPDLAAAGRFTAAARRTSSPPGPGQRVRHAAGPGLRAALRHPRRVRRSRSPAEALAHPRAGDPVPAGVPAVDRSPGRGRQGRAPASPSTTSMLRARRRPLPPARLDPLRRGQRRDLRST